jgi:hypothetical protein
MTEHELVSLNISSKLRILKLVLRELSQREQIHVSTGDHLQLSLNEQQTHNQFIDEVKQRKTTQKKRKRLFSKYYDDLSNDEEEIVFDEDDEEYKEESDNYDSENDEDEESDDDYDDIEFRRIQRTRRRRGEGGRRRRRRDRRYSKNSQSEEISNEEDSTFSETTRRRKRQKIDPSLLRRSTRLQKHYEIESEKVTHNKKHLSIEKLHSNQKKNSEFEETSKANNEQKPHQMNMLFDKDTNQRSEIDNINDDSTSKNKDNEKDNNGNDEDEEEKEKNESDSVSGFDSERNYYPYLPLHFRVSILWHLTEWCLDRSEKVAKEIEKRTLSELVSHKHQKTFVL